MEQEQQAGADAYRKALASYLSPSGDTVAARDVERFEAVLAMRRIARTLAVEVHKS